MQLFHDFEDGKSGIEQRIAVLAVEDALHFSAEAVEGRPVLEVRREDGVQFVDGV